MLVANLRSISIGLGELVVNKEETVVLTCIGLGSCIAMCAYDPSARIGGMAHMLLPSCRKGDVTSPAAKYIDSGVPLLISRIVKHGADKNNLIIKVAGGARMLSIPGENTILDVGQRNIAQIKAALAKENLSICGADLGGNFGRTVQFYIDTGRIMVKSVNGNQTEL
jgi:chemotaxis protein CheD